MPSTNRQTIPQYLESLKTSPLPEGASTEATLLLVKAALDYLRPLVEGSTVSGTVALDAATLAALETINVGNFPATQPVSGTIALDAPTLAALETISVANFPATYPVTGTFWQATQPVSGTFWQATQPVSAATLPLPSGASTSALQTQPGVDIGDVTINNASGASAVNIQDGGNSVTVDGTFWQATQPVSGTFWQTTQPVSIATAPALVASSAIIGKVGIDQTTPGTTNAVQIAGGAADATNAVLAMAIKPIAATTYSLSTFKNLGASATLNVKSSPGSVFSISCYNSNAASRFVQLHDTATTPAGSAVPAYSFLVPPSSQVIIGSDFFGPMGTYFANGIAFSFSTTINTYTAATAGDQSTFVQYK